jgi:hypothetical protein
MTFDDYMKAYDSPESYSKAKAVLRNCLRDAPVVAESTVAIRPPSLTASVAALMASKRKK